VPDVVELTLGKLLASTPSKLAKDVGKASLVVVRSQEIDFVGEMDSDLLARQVMDTVLGNLARAVRKLAAAGVGCFILTADHASWCWMPAPTASSRNPMSCRSSWGSEPNERTDKRAGCLGR
jgi:hypothetical protein